jgi:hypothetical protein
METNIVPIPDKRKIKIMEKENVAMDIDNEAEAEKEIERQPIPDRFSYHKEGEATLETFLHLYDASTRSTTSALYKSWMENISNIKTQQLDKQVRYTRIVSLNREPFPVDRIQFCNQHDNMVSIWKAKTHVGTRRNKIRIYWIRFFPSGCGLEANNCPE